MISFAIPIYNAEKIILKNYRILKEQLGQGHCDYEILFLDDASKDRSRRILEDISKNDTKVKVFSHPFNQGLGAGLRKLFSAASGDILAYLDIDFPFGAEALPKLLKEVSQVDVVLASRYLHQPNKISFLRGMASRLYYFFCKVLFNISVRDIGSGMVVFKKEVIRNITLVSCGFDIHIEFFSKAQRQGFSIKEMPLEYRYNGYSTFSILRHGPGILVNTLKYWLKEFNRGLTSATPLFAVTYGGETSVIERKPEGIDPAPEYDNENLFTQSTVSNQDNPAL